MSLHPEGQFPAFIRDHGLSTSSTGNPQLWVKFETEHGTINGWFAMTDRAIQYTVEKVRNMGFDGHNFADLNKEPAILAGKEVTITVSNEEYKGKIRAKVQFVDSPDSDGGKPKKDDDAAKAASRFDALLRKDAKAKKPTREPGDDVPF